MEEIALIIGHHYIYWSAVIRVLAAAAAICAFCGLYLKVGNNPMVAVVGVPLMLLGSLMLSRVTGWYFHPQGTLEEAVTFGQPGGYALMGVFFGCILAAILLRLGRLTDNLPQLLDCMAVAGALGIALGRLSSGLNVSDRGMILPGTVGFPWAAEVINPVSGAAEHRLAVFLIQAMVSGAILMILLTAMAGKERKDGDICLLFFLFYGASQVVLDSTRYDSLHFRSNGFIGAVQVFSALAVAVAVIWFAVRLVRAGGWKKWYLLLWMGQTACLGLAGYMEYYVQRHGGEAVFAYSTMSAALAGLILSALLTRHLAAAEEKKHTAWLNQMRDISREETV